MWQPFVFYFLSICSQPPGSFLHWSSISIRLPVGCENPPGALFRKCGTGCIDLSAPSQESCLLCKFLDGASGINHYCRSIKFRVHFNFVRYYTGYYHDSHPMPFFFIVLICDANKEVRSIPCIASSKHIDKRHGMMG